MTRISREYTQACAKAAASTPEIADMDDSRTSALVGAVQAIQQMLFGDQTASAAENPGRAPGDVRDIKGSTDAGQLPAGYITDSAADVTSRLPT